MRRTIKWLLLFGALLGLIDFVSKLATCQREQQEESQQSSEGSCGVAQRLTYRAIVAATEWIDTKHDFITAAATLVVDASKQITALAEVTLMRLADHVGTIDPGTFVTILIILVVFATASRRLLFFLGGALLALVGFLALLVPNSATIVIALGAGLGSLLITFAGIRSRRREAIERQRFDKLSRVVEQLQLVEKRQFLQSLNSQSRKVSQAEERSPIATGDVAKRQRHSTPPTIGTVNDGQTAQSTQPSPHS